MKDEEGSSAKKKTRAPQSEYIRNRQPVEINHFVWSFHPKNIVAAASSGFLRKTGVGKGAGTHSCDETVRSRSWRSETFFRISLRENLCAEGVYGERDS